MTLADLLWKLLDFVGLLLPFVVVDEWEGGVRQILGRTRSNVGPGLVWKWPVIGAVQTTTVTWRVTATPPQTLSYREGAERTVSFGVRWRVVDVKRLWDTIQEPESTLVDEVRSAAGELAAERHSPVFGDSLADEVLACVEETVEGWGLEVDRVRVIDHTAAQVLRLIQGGAEVLAGEEE